MHCIGRDMKNIVYNMQCTITKTIDIVNFVNKLRAKHHTAHLFLLIFICRVES